MTYALLDNDGRQYAIVTAESPTDIPLREGFTVAALGRTYWAIVNAAGERVGTAAPYAMNHHYYGRDLQTERAALVARAARNNDTARAARIADKRGTVA